MQFSKEVEGIDVIIKWVIKNYSNGNIKITTNKTPHLFGQGIFMC